MNITYDGNRFVAENNAGLKIPMGGNNPQSGGSSCCVQTTINPTELFLSSLGGCTSMHVVSLLSKQGIEPEAFSVSVNATRSTIPPGLFESMHLIFSMKGKMEERIVADAIEQAITVLCPIALSFRKVATITWEHQIEN
jgi:putative redox protein